MEWIKDVTDSSGSTNPLDSMEDMIRVQSIYKHKLESGECTLKEAYAAVLPYVDRSNHDANQMLQEIESYTPEELWEIYDGDPVQIAEYYERVNHLKRMLNELNETYRELHFIAALISMRG